MWLLNAILQHGYAMLYHNKIMLIPIEIVVN